MTPKEPTMAYASMALIAACLTCDVAGQQAVGPPRDGEIRVGYSDLQEVTDVTLTLEPQSNDGKSAPSGMLLTFTWRFPGKSPKSRATEIEVRAYAGLVWAPRTQLWFSDDGWKLDLGPPNLGFANTGGSDYLSAMMPTEALERLGKAARVAGNALGFAFELSKAQREALRAFAIRVLTATAPSA